MCVDRSQEVISPPRPAVEWTKRKTSSYMEKNSVYNTGSGQSAAVFLDPDVPL